MLKKTAQLAKNGFRSGKCSFFVLLFVCVFIVERELTVVVSYVGGYSPVKP